MEKERDVVPKILRRCCEEIPRKKSARIESSREDLLREEITAITVDNPLYNKRRTL